MDNAVLKIREGIRAYFAKVGARPPVIVVDAPTFTAYVDKMSGTAAVPARGNVTYDGIPVITMEHFVLEVTAASDEGRMCSLEETALNTTAIAQLQTELREVQEGALKSMTDCIKAANADIADLTAKHERELAVEKARADTLAECFSHVVEVLADRTRETEH